MGDSIEFFDDGDLVLIGLNLPYVWKNDSNYFIGRTQKTYIQFLTEVRIGFVYRMLIENKRSIQQVAFDCRFYNLSNFNRSFRLQKNQKPAEYKQVFGGLKS